MRHAVKVLVLLACIAYPLLVHSFISDNDAHGWKLLLVILPLMLVLFWFIFRALSKKWRPILALAFPALIYLIAAGQHERIGLIAVDGVSHATLNLLLCWFFGSTLLKGKEPLITQISRRVNGELKPEIAIYTRKVTIAWTLYFLGQVVVSFLLYLFSPLTVWSFFINVLNVPLLASMFIGEYAWRNIRYPHHSHTTIAKAIEVYTRDVAPTKKH